MIRQNSYYVLEMFPILRVKHGSCKNYALGDVVARYKKMCGYNVMHLWDGMRLTCRKCSDCEKKTLRMDI